jgi:hypothetical protein
MGRLKLLLTLLLLAAPISAGDSVQPGRAPVLVELFTSEGCSSCPPADALLMKLNDTQPIAGVDVIALEEHVDYWDRLGWRDPFSSADLTERQRQYAARLRLESAYTPEMVIDGQTEFVGNDSQKAGGELAKAAARAKTPVRLTLGAKSGDQVSLGVQVDAAGSGGDVVLAITERSLASDVTRGENAGRNMKHSAVVRKLVAIGKVKKGEAFSKETAVTLASDWKPENLSAVVFVQERGSGKVLGAVELRLER